MGRPVTLFTAQFSDMPFDDLCKLAQKCGYDGLEVATFGGYLDIEKAAEDKAYCDALKAKMAKYGLKLWAISNHFAGQLVCDPNNDSRSDGFGMVPKKCNGKPEAKREWAVESMKASAKAAKNLGISVVNGFTGSSIWHMLYSFPPVSDKMVDDGFKYFAKMWNPILDEFDKYGIKFALEVHPTEIAFDLYTAKKALEAIDYRPAFGFNFDPSHLLWQGMDPAQFIREFPDRIYHVHIKDSKVTLDGKTGILSSHINFGQPNRGWDFRSPGHGGVNFEEIIRELNRIGYQGPLSVEWEDSGMNREYGAKDACAFVRKIDFPASDIAFDAAFER